VSNWAVVEGIVVDVSELSIGIVIAGIGATLQPVPIGLRGSEVLGAHAITGPEICSV
jgi:hypothetical protein